MLDAGMVVAGTPKDCIEVLDRFRDVGVDQVIIHMQMGGVPQGHRGKHRGPRQPSLPSVSLVDSTLSPLLKVASLLND